MKKVLSWFLCLIMMVCVFGIVPFRTDAATLLSETEFANKLNELRSKYPNGGTYSGTYYENGVAKAWTCYGYACQMFYEVFGAKFYYDGYYNKKDYTMGTIYAGDIVRLDAGYGPDTHSVFVTKVTNDRIYFTDGNYNNKNGIRWDASYTISDFKNRFTYKVHMPGNFLTGNPPVVSNPWINVSKASIFSGESISFTFGANNATSYKITVKHLGETVKEVDNVRSGVSYTFTEEGTYTAHITAKNGSFSVASETVSFYVVNALDLGSYFIAKLNNPISGYYVSAETLGSTNSYPNVYLASENSNSNNEWKFIRQEDCSYKIINVETGYYLNVSGASTENGTNIDCYPNNNTDAQRWYIRKNNSGYALVPKMRLSSDLSITGNNTIYGDCVFNGANITLYDNDSVQSQRFVFEYTVLPINEWIKIDKTKATSEDKIKFEFGSGYTQSYTLHVDFRDGSTFEQRIESGESLSFDKSGQCTAYIICNLEDGTKIQTEKVTFYNIKIYNLGQSFKAKIKNTTSNFYIASTDITDGYGNVIIASENYNNNNVWRFDRQIDGSYKITNEKTGLLLDLYGGLLEDKTNIISSSNNNSNTQCWFITSNVDGYAFAPKNDYTRYLSVFENDTIWWYGEHTDGANVVLYDLDNVQSQRFDFVNLVTIYTIGDLNGDSAISATDALSLLQGAVGKVILTTEQQLAGDVNGDGDITSADALLVLQYSVGKITKFPVEK